MFRRSLLLAVLALAISSAAQAQSDCSAGARSDDGTFESGYGIFEGVGAFALRTQPLFPQAKLTRICVCWSRSDSDLQNDFEVSFDIVIWKPGTDGAPDQEVGRIEDRRADVPNDLTQTFYDYEISAADIVVDGPFYLGIEWDALEDDSFFLCADENGPGGQPAYAGIGAVGGPPDLELGIDDFFPGYRSMGLRADMVASGACTDTETTVCLQGGRFSVEATFTTLEGEVRTGRAERFSNDTGYFWFLDAANIETTVKVLDACSFSNTFWVFAGGMTNLEVELRVTDTETNAQRVYRNERGENFRTVADTAAFATCP